MRVDVVTLFPEMFAGPFDHSIVGRARAAGLVAVGFSSLREFATDKHSTCDDTPFGGGGGMVMKPEPMARALDRIVAESAAGTRPHVAFLSPQGRVFTQAVAAELAALPHLVLVCGRYEAIDQRVVEAYADEELSIGDYVLSGGEPAAIVIVDAIVRLLPGALGCADSATNDSFSPGREGLLDCPHYTRPEVWRGQRVPDVLLSGHHAKVARWRREESLRLTWQRRPELLARATLTKADRAYLDELAASGPTEADEDAPA